MSAKPFENFCIDILGDADPVFVGKGDFSFRGLFDEFTFRGAALRALFGSIIAFVNITADGADKFLHGFKILFSVLSGGCFGCRLFSGDK